MVYNKNWHLLLLGSVVPFFAFAFYFSTGNALGGQYVAAIVRIAHSEPEYVPSRLSHQPLNRFRILRNTLARQIRSEFVLGSALNRKDIAELKTVREQEPKAFSWLQRSLTVELPEDSELVILTLKSAGDTEELRKILSSVIDAFKNDVVGKDRMHSEERRAQVEKFFSEASQEHELHLERYLSLKNELGDSDSDRSSLEMLKLGIEVERDFLADLHRELLGMKLNAAVDDGFFRVLQPPSAVIE